MTHGTHSVMALIIILLVIGITDRLIFASQVRFTGSNFSERKYEVIFWLHGKEYYASLPLSA